MNNAIPITVFVAITLFFLKELLEFVRKIRSERRKKKAYMYLLADEIEKNHWTIKTLKRHLLTINKEMEFKNIELFKSENGVYTVRTTDIDSGSYSKNPLPVVHTSIFDRIFVDVAALDKKLFDLATDAYSSLAEIEHVRTSFIKFFTEEKDKLFLEPFSEYGLSEIEDAMSSLGLLYKKCTNKNLENHKLRSYA